MQSAFQVLGGELSGHGEDIRIKCALLALLLLCRLRSCFWAGRLVITSFSIIPNKEMSLWCSGETRMTKDIIAVYRC